MSSFELAFVNGCMRQFCLSEVVVLRIAKLGDGQLIGLGNGFRFGHVEGGIDKQWSLGQAVFVVSLSVAPEKSDRRQTDIVEVADCSS